MFNFFFLEYLDRSPKKTVRERKPRQTNQIDGTASTGAASSENDE